jgi:methyl-accepting chemotaxis protein
MAQQKGREQNRRRKRIILDKKLQLRMTMAVTGFVYFYLVLFALLANSGAILTVVSSGDSDQEYLAAVNRLKLFMQTFVLPLGITFVCMILHGFFFTQRIAGPLARMRETLKAIASGNLSGNLQIRKGDLFHDLCDEVNGLVGNLREEFMHFRKLSLQLAEEGEELSESGDLSPNEREAPEEEMAATA